MLQIVCGYHSLPVPERGCDLFFQPLEHLQSIEYRRPAISSLGFSESYLDLLNPVEVFLLFVMVFRACFTSLYGVIIFDRSKQSWLQLKKLLLCQYGQRPLYAGLSLLNL